MEQNAIYPEKSLISSMVALIGHNVFAYGHVAEIGAVTCPGSTELPLKSYDLQLILLANGYMRCWRLGIIS
jgi:hypothetical protein